jgi:hypothetical protein
MQENDLAVAIGDQHGDLYGFIGADSQSDLAILLKSCHRFSADTRLCLGGKFQIVLSPSVSTAVHGGRSVSLL